MCVIFFYANSNPLPGGYKLILASNRDEFYHRETRCATKWMSTEGGADVYGGIDLEPGREGGTWLAIGHNAGVFKVGALLNLTGEPKPRNAVGRGMIVTDFVSSMSDCTIDTYNDQLVADCSKYSAFNFVSIEIGDRKEPARITLCSNLPPSLEIYDEAQCYGFGNSLPAAPFAKVRHGQQEFAKIVEAFQRNDTDAIQPERPQPELIGQLKTLLKCKQKFWPDAELQRRAPKWGVDLSAINVNIPHEDYGSRTHTIVLVDSDDRMHFIEETMAGQDPDGEWLNTHIEKQF